MIHQTIIAILLSIPLVVINKKSECFSRGLEGKMIILKDIKSCIL